jgi:hypothetical protein
VSCAGSGTTRCLNGCTRAQRDLSVSRHEYKAWRCGAAWLQAVHSTQRHQASYIYTVAWCARGCCTATRVRSRCGAGTMRRCSCRLMRVDEVTYGLCQRNHVYALGCHRRCQWRTACHGFATDAIRYRCQWCPPTFGCRGGFHAPGRRRPAASSAISHTLPSYIRALIIIIIIASYSCCSSSSLVERRVMHSQ